MEIRKAQRKRAKLRIGVSWPSGSGKTYSSLLLARGIASDWNKICLIDTENWSGELYSHLGEYNAITLNTFSPQEYEKAIETCEKAGMEVIIIDSMTHEWKYLLERADQITQASASKNSYTAWAQITPIHDKFIQKILQSSCHIITTVRSKQDYDMTKNSAGKTVVQKVGMKQETRDGFEYELTLSLDVDTSHIATQSKDRTGLFSDPLWFKISEDTGKILKEWNESGKDEEAEKEKIHQELLEKIKGAETFDELKEAFDIAKDKFAFIGKIRSEEIVNEKEIMKEKLQKPLEEVSEIFSN